MCYRDMTFCKEDTCRKREDCFRYFSKEVREEAERWWGGSDVPVCYYIETPPCFEREQ